MGIEFTITKDMATVSSTISELKAINALICEEIGSEDFRRQYDSLLFDVLNTYRVVLNILKPLTCVNSLDSFHVKFDNLQQCYSENYQSALSEPRINAEFTFEKYLQFRKRRETKTSYPPLKRTFSRLHDYIDKWIDNDIWLAMTIDTLLKMLNRFLTEVGDIKKSDEESAYHLYQSCLGNIPAFLHIIASSLEAIDKTQTNISAQTHSSELQASVELQRCS